MIFFFLPFLLALLLDASIISEVKRTLLLSNLEIWTRFDPSIANDYICNDEVDKFPHQAHSILQNFIIDLDAYVQPHRKLQVGRNSPFLLKKIQKSYLNRFNGCFKFESEKIVGKLLEAHGLCSNPSTDLDFVFNQVLFKKGFLGLNSEMPTNRYHLHVFFLAFNFYSVYFREIQWNPRPKLSLPVFRPPHQLTQDRGLYNYAVRQGNEQPLKVEKEIVNIE
jgi:hypothetical protein